MSIRHFITDLGPAYPQDLLPVGEAAAAPRITIHRYGVWESGGNHRKPEVVATSDGLAELQARYPGAEVYPIGSMAGAE